MSRVDNLPTKTVKTPKSYAIIKYIFHEVRRNKTAIKLILQKIYDCFSTKIVHKYRLSVSMIICFDERLGSNCANEVEQCSSNDYSGSGLYLVQGPCYTYVLHIIFSTTKLF